MLINVGINLSKIKTEAINVSEKTGDKWINATVRLHSEDKFGNVLSIKQYTGNKEEHIYIGNGKVVVFKEDYEGGDNSGEGVEGEDKGEEKKSDDLPF